LKQNANFNIEKTQKQKKNDLYGRVNYQHFGAFFTFQKGNSMFAIFLNFWDLPCSVKH